MFATHGENQCPKEWWSLNQVAGGSICYSSRLGVRSRSKQSANLSVALIARVFESISDPANSKRESTIWASQIPPDLGLAGSKGMQEQKHRAEIAL